MPTTDRRQTTLLLSVPFAPAGWPSIGLSLLKAQLTARGLPVELQAAQPLPQGDAVFTRVFYEYEPFGDRFVRSKVKIELPGTRVDSSARSRARSS